MKKIDPLYILLLSFVLVVVLDMQVISSKKEIKENVVYLNDVTSIAKNFKQLNEDWSDKKQTIKKIEKIITSSGIKNFSKDQGENKIKYTFENINIKKMDELANKIFNEKLNIIKFDIEEKNLSFEVRF